ncbi:hypothetical protein PGTUg99_019179 [Puccinia graminis f. sp. tritici]|uniref:BED-type domain-containing protein n=1 Tax=Puccinia graminis f. sp. tritici TaxID=56615 RepID=A0A5B0SI37_PUCGR|nr:hypothetical protein PGTUg99_019179 [Puccinia graminis f. sp. tritici]
MAPEPSESNVNTGENETSDVNAGYTTDQSQNQLRRSTRASSAVLPPNMVAPSSDSRVRVNRPGGGPPKRCAAVLSSDVESVQSTASAMARSRPSKKKSRTQVYPGTEKSDKARPKPKKSKRASAASESHSKGASEPAYDYDQDSGDEDVEIQPRDVKTSSTKAAKEAETAELLRYFQTPFWKKGDAPGTALNYKCRWCQGVYRRQKLSHGNLKTHQDGSTQDDKCDKGCTSRNKAKKAGFVLPLSVAERRALEANDGGKATQQGIKGFLEYKPAFVNRVLNQLVMIWQIRQALPWSRIEDPFLRAAFRYSNSKAQLYGRRWSADESKKLYDMLKTQVFHELNNLNTQFTLIHDVWTTKGNRFAFIGAAVAFINDEWEYTVRHLTLKMIPWKHAGHLLARPIAKLLKKNQLYKKIS